jgi:nucleotide-binding universal stress UspA family protein
MTRPSVLCPIDFSDASRGALRCAAALAAHFYASLTVINVNDGHVDDVAAFVRETFAAAPPVVPELVHETAAGVPAVEILRVADQTHADVIVMSTHGAHGVRTMLGSVARGVLHGTQVPVIVTPPADPGPRDFEEWKRKLRRLLVPVDFSPGTPQQVKIARGLADAFGTELVFLHVLEDSGIDRRAAAHAELDRIIRETPPASHPVMTLATGDPAQHIARVARDRRVDGIVMALHPSPDPRTGMGHVTYGVLCQAEVMVLAVRTKNS